MACFFFKEIKLFSNMSQLLVRVVPAYMNIFLPFYDNTFNRCGPSGSKEKKDEKVQQ